jgi:type VII secretion integral membrane protein EccD
LTLPPSLSDLDRNSDSEPDLSRLTVVVGGLKIDVGLPADVEIADYVAEVIDIANEQIAARNLADDLRIDASADTWTLARLGGEPIDPHRTLSEAGIYDGDLIMIREVGRPVSPLLFDDVEEADVREKTAVGTWLFREGPALTCFAIALASSATLAMVMPRWSDDPVVPATAFGLGLLSVAFACALAYRPATAPRSPWLTAIALPLVFAGALFVVPNGHGTTSLPLAFASCALCSLVVLLISGSGRAMHTAVIATCAFGGAGATSMLLWQPPPRTVGALTATVAVIVVYLAPRATIALSKLPIPRVPTAGEPLDDIETQGGTTVEGVNAIGKQIIPTEEGLIGRVRRANEYLTGLLIGAALASVAGSYLAVDVSNGFFWQGTTFAVIVATVLCLRGRAHHDLVQSAVLIGSGLTIAIAVVGKTALYVENWQVRSLVALGTLMLVICVCGLVAPRREFSPVARRWVEIGEYVAIALMFPLCFWIIRVYAFFRELRI